MRRLLREKERNPNKGSFSLLEREEVVKICNQEMCDTAISVISKYINEHLFEMNSEFPRDCFKKLSYARWAAYEIIERLNNEAERLPPHITGSWREPIPPIDIIAGFIDEMECYIYDGCDEKHERIFTIAKDVAEDIIILFL